MVVIGLSASFDVLHPRIDNILLSRSIRIDLISQGIMFGLLIAILTKSIEAFFAQKLLQFRANWMRILLQTYSFFYSKPSNTELDTQNGEAPHFEIPKRSWFDRYFFVGLLCFTILGVTSFSWISRWLGSQPWFKESELTTTANNEKIAKSSAKFSIERLLYYLEENKSTAKESTYLEWLHQFYPTINLMPQDWQTCLNKHAPIRWRKNTTAWKMLYNQFHSPSNSEQENDWFRSGGSRPPLINYSVDSLLNRPKNHYSVLSSLLNLPKNQKRLFMRLYINPSGTLHHLEVFQKDAVRFGLPFGRQQDNPPPFSNKTPNIGKKISKKIKRKKRARHKAKNTRSISAISQCLTTLLQKDRNYKTVNSNFIIKKMSFSPRHHRMILEIPLTILRE